MRSMDGSNDTKGHFLLTFSRNPGYGGKPSYSSEFFVYDYLKVNM